MISEMCCSLRLCAKLNCNGEFAQRREESQRRKELHGSRFSHRVSLISTLHSLTIFRSYSGIPSLRVTLRVSTISGASLSTRA